MKLTATLTGNIPTVFVCLFASSSLISTTVNIGSLFSDYVSKISNSNSENSEIFIKDYSENFDFVTLIIKAPYTSDIVSCTCASFTVYFKVVPIQGLHSLIQILAKF